jgi:hypothetical protein
VQPIGLRREAEFAFYLDVEQEIRLIALSGKKSEIYHFLEITMIGNPYDCQRTNRRDSVAS